MYVVTGSNHESGQTHVTADGVTMYFGCQDGAYSTPKLRECAPGEEGGDRNNDATFGWRGNGTGASMDALVVVGDLQFSGVPSGFHLSYTESANIDLPAGAVGLTR